MSSLLSTLLLLGIQAIALQAVPPARDDAQQQARQALAALVESRSQIRSGVFRVSGHLDDSAEPDGITGGIEIYSAFDFNAGKIRFDRLEPCAIPAAASFTSTDADGSTRALQGGRFARTPEQSIYWGERMPVAVIMPANAKIPESIKPFDVRLVGWLGGDESDRSFETGPSWSDLVEEARELNYQCIQDNDETLCHLSRICRGHKDSHIEMKVDLWLDPQAGFSPVRQELRIRDGERAGDWPTEFGSRTLVNWTRVNEVWVPVSVLQESFVGPPRRRELNFEWVAVNQQVDPSLFTLEGLGYPDNMELIDTRSGTAAGKPKGGAGTAEDDAFGIGRRPVPALLRHVSAVVSRALLAAAICYVVWRRWNRYARP